MAPTLDITDQIRNVEPGSYQVKVSLLDTAGAELVSKASAVDVPVPTPLDEDPPTVKVS